MRVPNIFILLAFTVLLAAPVVYASHEPGHITNEVDFIANIANQLSEQLNGVTPSAASGFSRDGVYGCTGAAYGAVGQQGPGGAHVPVFDDAVFDQEKLLTYKECLLDGINNSARETLISFIIKGIVRWSNEGFDGNPAYVTNLPLYLLEDVADPVTENFLLGPSTEAIAEPYRRDIRVALAKSYANKTRQPQNALGCSLPPQQLTAFLDGDFYGGGGWDSFFTLSSNSSCNPLFAYYNAENQLVENIISAQERERTKLNWGNGFRTVESNETLDLGGGQFSNTRRIVTPGFMIAEQLRQTIGTGLRQAENADEIDEMISALMSNIGTEMFTNTSGFAGLSKSFSGQPSYIDRIATAASERTRSNLVGAAASIVNNTARVEEEYVQVRQSSVAVLRQSQLQLETWENTCWAGLVAEAKKDLSAQVVGQACANAGLTTELNPCNITAVVTTSVALNAIGIRVPTAGSITVAGRASKGGSTIEVTAVGESITVGPIQPTVNTEGVWKTSSIDLSSIPDGDITVTVTETLAGGAGTPAPIIVQVKKVTTITGIELTPPVAQPAITITATARGISASATITENSARSRAVVGQNVKPILDLIRDNIFRSGKALEVLGQLRAALASTTSTSGQRFILEKIDQLVAARVLHTEAQLRQAQGQSLEIEGAMKQLLEETRGGWEAGWCKPSNWQQSAL